MTQTKKAVLRYIAGFISSIVLTLVAYYLTTHHILSGWNTVYAILVLALVQAAAQLVFFMHLGEEREPRWQLLVFDFTLIILVILVVGSLWIMKHLDYGMQHMTPNQTNTYLHNHEDF